MGREVADAAAPVGDRVPPPAIGIHGRPAAHALVDELEDRLVVQLVVPALETLGTDDLVPAEIGSASCRESVCPYVSISVSAVSFKKKNYKHIKLYPHNI